MKIRTSFVSNSSSSSFVLELKDRSSTKVKIEIEVDFSKLGTIVSTEEELEKYALEDSYFPEEMSEKYMEDIKNGKILLFGTVSNEDNENNLSNFFYEHGIKNYLKGSPNIKVLEDPLWLD